MIEVPAGAGLGHISDPAFIPERTVASAAPSSVKMMNATVHNAYAHGEFYDLLFEDGSIVTKFPAAKVHSKGVSIYWRFLR
jgi:hypothetical protein